MAKVKRSDAQEKRLAALRAQDEKLRVTKTLTDGTVIFRYVQAWQRSEKWATTDKGFTYAMDVEGNVYGYCWKPVPPGSGFSEIVTYPEKHKPRERAKASSKRTVRTTAPKASAKPAAKPRVRRTAEVVALAEAAA